MPICIDEDTVLPPGHAHPTRLNQTQRHGRVLCLGLDLIAGWVELKPHNDLQSGICRDSPGLIPKHR